MILLKSTTVEGKGPFSSGRLQQSTRRDDDGPLLLRLKMEITEDAIRRFWEKVDRRGPNECWEWQGYRMPRGYGRMRVGIVSEMTHRISMVIANGEIPPGICVLHTCDNPPCCNPAHLWAGTQQENMSDKASKGRSHRFNGEDHPRAKLTWVEVREIRRLYALGSYTQARLGEAYGVSDHQIGQIVNLRKWRAAPMREEE